MYTVKFSTVQKVLQCDGCGFYFADSPKSIQYFCHSMLSTLWQLNAHEARFIGFSILAPIHRNILYQFREIYSSSVEKYFLTEIYFVGYIRSSICSALEKLQQLSPLLSCSRSSSGCGGGGQMIFQIHPFYIFFLISFSFTLIGLSFNFITYSYLLFLQPRRYVIYLKANLLFIHP